MTFARLFTGSVGPYIQGEKYEITNYWIAGGERHIRPDGPSAIDAANNTSGGVRGGGSDAIVAEFSGFHHYGWSEFLDVGAHSEGLQISEYGENRAATG
jgi:hypothetical protein